MKNPARLLLLPLLLLGGAPVQAQTAAPKPGYTVVSEITFDEEGVPDEVTIVESDDPTGDRALEQMVLKMSRQDKQPPRMKDGKAVRFKARRPFNFPVEGDNGEAYNANRPVLRSGHQDIPVYPEDMAAKGEVGGAIIELAIQTDGTVQAVRPLRSSHPEFAEAAMKALSQWTFNPDTAPGSPAVSYWRAAIGFTLKDQPVDLKWRLAPRPSLGGFIIGRLPPAAKNADVSPIAPPATEEKK